MTPPILELRDVRVAFGGVVAVAGVSLDLRPGVLYGLLGPNGSGKSTLLAAVTRLVDVSAGDLYLDGERYTRSPRSSLAAKGIARTFQTVRLLRALTVRENVQAGADLFGWLRRLDRRAREALVDEVIERTRLTGHVARRPSELSYGTQRRVEIARALAMRPRLLLLDEPTAGMNDGERADVARLLAELRQAGLTQLLVEHDVQMMVDTCDRLFAMDVGRIVAEGAPRDVVRTPAVQESYLGVRPADDA